MKTFLCSVCIFAFQFLHASSFRTIIDTTIVYSKEEYKLNEDNFLKAYGKDDSSKALIKYFFYKRSLGKKMILVPVAPLVVAGVTAIILSNNEPQQQQIPYGGYGSGNGILIALLLFFSIGTFVPLAINGTVITMVYSRKKLLYKLENYFAGNGIPKRIARSKTFIAFLHGAKTINRHYLPRRSNSSL